LKWQHLYRSIDKYRNIYICIPIPIYMLPFQTEKQKPRPFSLICLFFAHCANESLSFVCLFTKKQTEVIHFKRSKQTKRTFYIYGIF
jgi:hypothetical protein